MSSPDPDFSLRTRSRNNSHTHSQYQSRTERERERLRFGTAHVRGTVDCSSYPKCPNIQRRILALAIAIPKSIESVYYQTSSTVQSQIRTIERVPS